MTFAPVPVSAATTITVDTTDGFSADNGNCSLHEALISAINDGSAGFPGTCAIGSDPGPDIIEFDIPGTPPHTIVVTEILPFITEAVTILGTSEPDYVDAPVVALDGSSFTGSAQGLLITTGGGGSSIIGLGIHSFPGNGITISGGATGNTIQGNYLGTDLEGTGDLGNGDSGVGLSATGNQIGGDVVGEGNLISGNESEGIESLGGNTIEGNLIGTDITGTADLGNGSDGISATGSPEIIGGPAAGARNVISGNGGHGISLGADGSLIQGNVIGTDAAAATALGNDGSGVRMHAFVDDVNIGGESAGEPNVIAFNGEDGISTLSNTGVDNAFLVNALYENGELGIDLGNDGVTENEPNDPDPGANNLQNFPEITSVTPGATTTVNGTLDTDSPNTFFRLEFFVQDAPDPSQFGEGETYIGTGEVQTDPSGDETFSVGGLDTTSPSQAVTATATELTATGGTPLSTSELSEAFFLCTVTGTTGNDPALGGTVGDDVICALDGDDTINGSPGDDIIIGGEGDDEIRYTSSPVALDIDLTAGTTTTAGAKNDVLLDVEDATGGSRNDTLSGVPGEDNDLDGGAGNGDTVDYSGHFSFGVNVDLGTGIVSQDGDDGEDTVANFEDVIGSDRPDTLGGTPGVPNVLDGGVGVGDTASYVAAPTGVIVDLEQQQAIDDGGGEIDTFINMADVTGSLFSDELTGDAGDNVLNALNGDDVMVGGEGDDNLAGGADVDTGDYSGNLNGITADLPAEVVEGGSTDDLFSVEVFIGTPFDDTFVDEPGVDNTYEAGAGTDRISYSAAPTGVTLDLGASQVANDGDGGTDSFTSVEDGTGSSLGDSITGDAGANDLVGGGGADDLRGMGGVDTLQGGGGNDVAGGGDDNDTVQGGDGDDSVLGDLGNDIVRGEAGNDSVAGGEGNDTTDAGEGEDTVLGEGGDDVMSGLGGNDTLTGGEGNDTASGGGGKDTANGQAGKDTLKGGGGKDKCVGGGGKDKESSCE
jgi:Ca2+-binding RTX toxin-like protein